MYNCQDENYIVPWISSELFVCCAYLYGTIILLQSCKWCLSSWKEMSAQKETSWIIYFYQATLNAHKMFVWIIRMRLVKAKATFLPRIAFFIHSGIRGLGNFHSFYFSIFDWDRPILYSWRARSNILLLFNI